VVTLFRRFTILISCFCFELCICRDGSNGTPYNIDTIGIAAIDYSFLQQKKNNNKTIHNIAFCLGSVTNVIIYMNTFCNIKYGFPNNPETRCNYNCACGYIDSLLNCFLIMSYLLKCFD
jgi:hypothetical protein